MGKVVWIVIAAVVVGGGYYAWTQFGTGGVASYQAEKLAGRVCNTIMREIKVQGIAPEKAVEIGDAEFVALAKERIGRDFARDEFKFGVEGKTCKAAIVITEGEKQETVRFKKDY